MLALAGAITGGVGQAIASPTDVVKVRLQADGRLKALGQLPRYKVRSPSPAVLRPTAAADWLVCAPPHAPQGTIDAFVRIPVEEGFKGYFRGIGPSIMRAAANNGGGIAAYDHTKQVRTEDGRAEGSHASLPSTAPSRSC